MDNRTKHFKIRLTPELHKSVRLAAAELEKSIQEFLERLIMEAMKKSD